MAQPALGFIGLGLMGSAMVQRLIDLGFGLTVLGRHNRTGVEAAKARGAREAANARDLAASSDLVLLCMDTSASVEARLRGPDGVVAGLRPGALVIDFGTSLPGSTRALAAEVEAAGGRMMDAPLGRTPTHGREGKLNIMAGGSDADFARAKLLLDGLGENVFHVGPLGAGHTLKLVNNFFAQTMAATLAEAFAIADHAGLPRAKLYEVMAAGPLRSGFMDFMKAYAIDGDPTRLAFSIANARKDVGYYADMAEGLGLPSLMSGATKTVLGLAKAEGFGGRMVPELVDWFAKLYGETR